MPPILVVDDDPDVRRTIRQLLEDEGLAVETAADGQQAVGRIARLRPALVVLDLSLPHLSGQAVAQALRAGPGPVVPILVITADGRAEEKARRVGAYAALHKPFGADELLDAVRCGLGGGEAEGGPRR